MFVAKTVSMTNVCPQRILTECLNQIASCFCSDHSDKKVQLGKDLIKFLVGTPDVFEEPWTPRTSWTRPLYHGLFDIIKSKTSQEMMSTAIEITATLVRGYDGFKWATECDRTSSKFVGLVSRLACLELCMFLDVPHKDKESLIGSCLIIIEHTILLILNEDSVENLDPKMDPEEMCSLIDMLRETVMKIMDWLIDVDEDESTSTLSVDHKHLDLGFIRIVCLLLSEDATIPTERVAKLVTVFSKALNLNHSCYGLHHIIFTSFNLYSESEDVLEAVKAEKETLNRAIEQCQECLADSSLCQSFKSCLKE